MHITLEVIATQVADAQIADQAGADRIELISGILEGGLTPSYGMIEAVVHAVNIPVNVMIRPHSQSFRYSADDGKVMLRDVEMVRRLGACGIVVGALDQLGKVDEPLLQAILDKSGDMDVTFHRAFDEIADQEEAVACLLGYPQVNRVLTSGGKADITQATERIVKLLELISGTHMTILAGSGLKVETLYPFVRQTAVKEVHLGTGVRMNSQALECVDPLRIERVIQILREVGK